MLTQQVLPMSLDDERERLAKQLDYLAAELSRMEEQIKLDQTRMPSFDELAELRKIKLERERATWLWQMIRTYTPWIVGIGGPIVSAVWWLTSHFTWTPPKP